MLVCAVSFSFFLVSPKQAHAILGLGDITFDPANLAEMLVEWVGGEAFAALRDAAVKRIVDDLTDQVINSIENGGKPLFIEDPLAALQREGDIAFDTFNTYLENQSGFDLCAPFNTELSLYFQTTFQSEPRFGIPVSCTFDEFKRNLQDGAHLIESGGWISFQQAFVPSNNFFGASLLVDQAYGNQVAAQSEKTKLEYTVGGGFKGVSRCVNWLDPVTGLPAGPFDSDEEGSAAGAVCIAREDVTPGSVVAQTATKSVLKDFEYAANVQSILSALINSALSKIFDSSSSGGLFAAKSSNITGSTITSGFGDSESKLRSEMAALQQKYASLITHFRSLSSLAEEGQKRAEDAVLSCYACWNGATSAGGCKSGGSGSYGPPTWGTVVYGNPESSATRRYAALGTLLDYPHVIGAVQLPTSSDPNYPAEKDGYFTGLLGHEKNGPLYTGKTDAEKNIIPIQDLLAVQGNISDPQYTATLAKIRSDYSAYAQKYQVYANEILNGEYLNGGEPGSMGILSDNTFQAILNSVVHGLNRPDPPNNIGNGTDGNVYYCEPRS